ncbi:LysR family transcriptional regulator ArgP [Paucibacter sp. APW11]|uniref:LysR family transcriptional regulator ArgP n=1 Tax=Roseateles aquae TaxID=3077235 RepID=A0ABU3PFZ3_9BURK|nr:LysR family transcriptional regulator ArgP [Paucibacter sp. APW11]MDT9001443.1 LysR family transcriptional regulator ArgP [Paucibacter sp. APW11]
MLDYAALDALATVLREGSFERAAQALHVTPSAVSQRIRALEERVGCALVVRAQPCVATETGRRLSQHVDQVRLMEQQLQLAAPGLAAKAPARLPLAVAVNADSLATWAAAPLARFAASHPVLMDVAIDDQDHTEEWLRSGQVLAAVSSQPRAVAGCNSRPLGAMRYRAAASPDFISRYFSAGVGAGSLARAPSLVFNSKDELQARWARRLCHRHVELPRHRLPSSQAFVTAAVAGMGWGLHPEALIADELAAGMLVELVPDTPLDVPLFWQTARLAAGLLGALTGEVLEAAGAALRT